MLLGLLVASCSKFNKLLKSDDSEKKYAAAVKYYEKKDYYRAGQLFDDLLVEYRGTAKAEQVYYYYTYCKYFQYEIPTAAFHFKNFYETYPNSKYAEECLYMYAFSNYKESYPYNLDPTYTYKAIDVFQLFVNIYPQSKFVKECNELIDECRSRLRNKAYEKAKLYYRIEDYKAAYVSFQTLMNDFPDLENERKEESEYLITVSAYKYAEQSIDAKKTERYELASKAYEIYREDFPNGQYLTKLNSINQKAIEGAEKYRKKQKTGNNN